jgi:YVTN family beta-propeller protein
MTERFTLLTERGRVAMGVVWRARDEESGQIVALKLLRSVYAEDPDYLARFGRELELARRIDSPHVVKVLGYGAREGVPYLTLEYVDGASLRERLAEHGPYTWSETRDLLAQVAAGLAAAHAAGVLHRDVKPSNILVGADGVAKLTDFGIARGLDLTRVTGTSALLGTPAYLAPEGSADARSDLYSLGCVAYELLAGAVPFEGHTYQDVILAHVRTPPDLAKLPPEARPIVGWLLAKDPAERPQSAQALLAALAGQGRIPASAPRPAPTLATGTSLLPARASRRRLRGALLGAAVLALAMLLLVVGAGLIGRLGPPAPAPSAPGASLLAVAASVPRSLAAQPPGSTLTSAGPNLGAMVTAEQTPGSTRAAVHALTPTHGSPPTMTPRTYRVGVNPEGVAFDGTSIWVTNLGSNTVTKITVATGAVVGTYRVGDRPQGVVFDGTNIWVANFASNTVTKLVAATGAVVGTYSGVGFEPYALAFDGANIWVADYDLDTVTELAAATGAVVGTYHIGSSPDAVAFDGTSVWVANEDSNTVTKLAASTGDVVGTYRVGVEPDGLAFDGTSIWVTNLDSNTVTKLAAATGAVVGTYRVGAKPVGVSFDGANIWVADWHSNTVTKLVGATGAVVGTYRVGGGPYAMAFDGTNIWVTSFASNTVTKLTFSP